MQRTHSHVLQLAVLSFEADNERLVELVKRTGFTDLIKEVGDFYVEHYNFQLASQAYTIQAGFSDDPSDEVLYRLLKIHLLEGEQPTAHAALVRYDRHAHAGRAEPVERRASARHRRHARGVTVVGDVDDQGAVTIEEHGARGSHRTRRLAEDP
jgi:hypothetical protein